MRRTICLPRVRGLISGMSDLLDAYLATGSHRSSERHGAADVRRIAGRMAGRDDTAITGRRHKTHGQGQPGRERPPGRGRGHPGPANGGSLTPRSPLRPAAVGRSRAAQNAARIRRRHARQLAATTVAYGSTPRVRARRMPDAPGDTVRDRRQGGTVRFGTRSPSRSPSAPRQALPTRGVRWRYRWAGTSHSRRPLWRATAVGQRGRRGRVQHAVAVALPGPVERAIAGCREGALGLVAVGRHPAPARP